MKIIVDGKFNLGVRFAGEFLIIILIAAVEISVQFGME